MQINMVILPVGLIIYAWTAEKQVPWPATLLGALLFGWGMMVVYICAQIYLVEVFGRWAASAMAAVIVCRSALGCVFSLIGFELYRSLGYGWLVPPWK